MLIIWPVDRLEYDRYSMECWNVLQKHFKKLKKVNVEINFLNTVQHMDNVDTYDHLIQHKYFNSTFKTSIF